MFPPENVQDIETDQQYGLACFHFWRVKTATYSQLLQACNRDFRMDTNGTGFYIFS